MDQNTSTQLEDTTKKEAWRRSSREDLQEEAEEAADDRPREAAIDDRWKVTFNRGEDAGWRRLSVNYNPGDLAAGNNCLEARCFYTVGE